MATSDKPRSAEDTPTDLLPVIRKSGILSEKQFEDLKAKVLDGRYPFDPRELAARLVKDRVLTDYQAKRFLSNKPHGLTVGKYVILDRLGSGSMGRVYKAQHLLMGRAVALKIIAPEIVSNQRVVARFQREMKLVGRLDHPNVVRAFDADQAGSILYIVMEYVAGVSLGQRFRAKGPLPPLDVIDYAAQSALGLAHAHGQGIVHRDVKPSNLFLSQDGQVKVLDLGLGVLMEADSSSSFATADGIAVGTIDYMSPEQACGKEVDGRSDLYSLGCSMFHLISGRLPFPGDSPVERLGKRINGKPAPITDLVGDLPAGLAEVMEALLANRPHERFQTALEAAEALHDLLPPKESSGISRRPGYSGVANLSGASGSAIARPASASSMPSTQVAPPPAPPPEPEYVEVRPEYPLWFGPIASMAENSPAALVLLASLSILILFASGFLTALLIR